MKLKQLLSISLAIISLSVFGQTSEQNPVANPEAVVTVDNARFTVLTPRLIRMEYSPTGNFVDQKSLTFVNRDLTVPEFKVRKSGKKTVIKTADVELQYVDNGQPFSDYNLKATFKVSGKKQTWKPSMEDKGNLKGTTRTLDGADGITFRNGDLENGIISRDGWTLIDDSKNHILNPVDNHWGEWVAVRPDSLSQDWYLFAYGHDYTDALRDYQKVAGRAPLPPLYTFGYWWSRYWQYSDNELFDLVDKIKSSDIPIDVLIVDMDWHETYGLKSKNSEKDEYGQRIGWTGYSWQKELFPNHQNFLHWVKLENLKTALNLHPASGIQPYEDVYKDFIKHYGWADTTKSVPYRLDDPRWADAYFETVLGPMEKEGVDFWWPDWQQWKQSKYVPGLSNTFWLNKVFFQHAEEQNPSVRPFIYHRWGGLGSHRYPLGFSGDTYIEWSTLGYLPYFTSTASNVNYGYWGHDIGGHMFKNDGKTHQTDPELYLRWLQYGVFTPIFKTHSTKDMRIVRYPWSFPDHQFMMRDAIRLRYSLVPYIYNAARKNYDSGIAMTKPMYYNYPDDPKAYEVPQQFFFGDDILATVIDQPVDSVSGMAPRRMWFPEGKWYDFASGGLIESPADTTLYYTLAETPYYAEAGSIIPMFPDDIDNLQQPIDRLVLTFVPGKDEGHLTYYEDDGISADYDSVFAITEIDKRLIDNKVTVEIGSRAGTFAGAPSQRKIELRFPAMLPPAKVYVDGVEYKYNRFPGEGEWGYDAYSLQPIVYLPYKDVDKKVVVELDYNGVDMSQQSRLYGLRGLFNRAIDLTTQFKIEQGNHGENMKMLPKQYLKVSQAPNFIQEDPQNILRYLDDFNKNRSTLFETTDSMEIISEPFKKRLRYQLGE